MTINSLDVDKGIAMLDAEQLADLADYLATGVEQLAHSGADFAAIAANTPHLVFDEVQRRSAIACEHCSRDGQSGEGARLEEGWSVWYRFQRARQVLSRQIPAHKRRPGRAQRGRAGLHSQQIHRRAAEEPIPAGTRAEILRIAQRLKDEDGVEAIVLAGTELPLLLRDTAGDIQFLDTTLIHVRAIVDELLR